MADPKDSTRLLLGPFMGRVACQVIQVGKGVCGAAADRKKTVLVDDVDSFPGHIACDGDSKSEIVVPILVGNKVSQPSASSLVAPIACISLCCFG